MRLVKPTADELNQCFNLELQYSHGAEDWAREGFFLPGTEYSIYKQLLDEGYIRVLRLGVGPIAAFVVAVAPGHAIVERLVREQSGLLLFDEEVEIDAKSTVWVAKVATRKAMKRQGLAAKLYEEVFREFSGCTVLTATALSPKRNIPSEEFHRKMGMQSVGVFLSDNRELGKSVSIVWGKLTFCRVVA